MMFYLLLGAGGAILAPIYPFHLFGILLCAFGFFGFALEVSKPDEPKPPQP